MPLQSAPDLTQRPPRSPRVKLGGYVILPRMLDKGRALANKKNGEFNYDCSLDQNFVKFAGIDAKAMYKQLAAGKSDGEILEWVNQTSKTKPSPQEIAAWSEFQIQRGPLDVESRGFFNEMQTRIAPKREDVAGWFDILDIDDHVTFGGKA